MRRACLAVAAVLSLACQPALAQDSQSQAPNPESHGLSFRLVDDGADPSAHAGETATSFKDKVLWLEAETPITGRMVAAARPFLDGPEHRPTVAFRLTAEGASRLAELTKANMGRRIAILVDGKVLACPRIQAEMADGVGAISGDFTSREASLLALQISDAAGAH